MLRGAALFHNSAPAVYSKKVFPTDREFYTLLALKCHKSGKKKAHKLKKNPRDTGRVSLGHPAGQTGVYRPVSQGFPVIYCRKRDRKGHFCRDTGRVSQGHPAIQGVFRNFM